MLLLNVRFRFLHWIRKPTNRLIATFVSSDKFLRNKLLLSFIALVLIIKIIKIKLFWLLPIVIGVGAAKKLLLKFLLFLFPALTHLFKLCSYYQQSYHGTKYHQHHHLINHHHTVGVTVRDNSLPPTLTVSNSLALCWYFISYYFAAHEFDFVVSFCFRFCFR